MAKTSTVVLLVNLGTPTAPTPRAVRKYLREFLSDQRVVELPRLLWQPILNGFILPFRPRRVAKAYQSIWTSRGSPLLVQSQQIADQLQTKLAAKYGDDIRVELAMRYSEPNIREKLDQLKSQSIKRLVVLPLYPQYSASTTATVFDAVSKALKKWRHLPEVRFISQYADHPEYINGIANSIKAHWQNNQPGQKLIFSFHGLPQKMVDAGDPYQQQCQTTAQLVAQALNLQADQWQLVFQSRFGPAEWLQPYCDQTLEALPGKGVKSVDIICPGFAADCLETLEEIAVENREIFEKAGGERYQYIPALNSSKAQLDLMSTMVASQLFT